MTVYRLHHKFRTPYSPLISHRCQKEACTEIKGRIWALCSKIKLSVVIFYITFRTAYWKMFPLLGSLPPLPSVSFPFPSFFLFSFFSSLCMCPHRFPLPVHCIGMVTVTCAVPPLTTSTCILTAPEEHWFKSVSKLSTQRPSLSAQENIAHLYLQCHSWV